MNAKIFLNTKYDFFKHQGMPRENAKNREMPKMFKIKNRY
jgi:hypothetical protein